MADISTIDPYASNSIKKNLVALWNAAPATDAPYATGYAERGLSAPLATRSPLASGLTQGEPPLPAFNMKDAVATDTAPGVYNPTQGESNDAAAEGYGLTRRVISSGPELPGDLPPTPIYGAYKENPNGPPTGMGEHPQVGTMKDGSVGFSDSPSWLAVQNEKDPTKRAALRQRADVEQRYANQVAGARQVMAMKRAADMRVQPQNATEAAALTNAATADYAQRRNADTARLLAEAAARKNQLEADKDTPERIARDEAIKLHPGDPDAANRASLETALASGLPPEQFGEAARSGLRAMVAQQTHGVYQNLFGGAIEAPDAILDPNKPGHVSVRQSTWSHPWSRITGSKSLFKQNIDPVTGKFTGDETQYSLDDPEAQVLQRALGNEAVRANVVNMLNDKKKK